MCSADAGRPRSPWGLRERYWREHVINLPARHGSAQSLRRWSWIPITARQFLDRGGFDTKEKLIQMGLRECHAPGGVSTGTTSSIQNYVYPQALNGVEPYATMLKAAEDELIPMFRLEDIQVVVVGGETNGYWRIMSSTYDRSVSIDEWR